MQVVLVARERNKVRDGATFGRGETFGSISRLLRARAAAHAFSMKRSFRLSLLGIALAGALGVGYVAHCDQSDDRFNYTQFEMALDQISAGRLDSARQTLENTAAKGPLAETNANLLAYLQQRDGQSDAARRTLERVPNRRRRCRAFFSKTSAPAMQPRRPRLRTCERI